jgi:Fe-S-cluster containining protein
MIYTKARREMEIISLHIERPDLCTPCGGKCCKSMPGGTHPSDWGAPNTDVMLERLATAFRSGLWAIDWWEGDPRGLEEGDQEYVSQGFYVRPATKGDEGRVFYASWGGECTFLTATGCSFGHDDRPLECRTLEPKYPYRCEQHHGKHLTAIAWLPYHQVLLQAAGIRD